MPISPENSFLIGTWNLNNRAGKRRFRPEAADAAIAIGAHVLVFTEFLGKSHEEDKFRNTLRDEGWGDQVVSMQTREPANRVLIVSRLPLIALTLTLPDFDQQFPANLLAVTFPLLGLSVLGVRMPYYKRAQWRSLAWEWLEREIIPLKGRPSIIIGDLNATTSTRRLTRVLSGGWRRAAPSQGATFFGNGSKTEIDHIIGTSHCALSNAECIQKAGDFELAGSPKALSDHAALVCDVRVLPMIEAGI